MAKNPVVIQKLESQIDAVMPPPEDCNCEKTKLISNVDDIIETLKLKLGGPHAIPPDGI